MGIIIHNFIVDKKYFSLNLLNNRIKFYNFGVNINKPPRIEQKHLLKKQINLSASEMMCLVTNFSLIIGDLVVKDDPLWLMYLLLKQICNIVTEKAIVTEESRHLIVLIEEHHKLSLIVAN